MNSTHDPLRRRVIAALASLPVLSTVEGATGEEGIERSGSKTLVAYFSRSGNTRVVAGLIQRALQADVIEILPATAYPADYLETVDQARKERDSGFEPVLGNNAISVESYDTIFLGFPIWGETVPAVIRSFLSSHDPAGKNIVPFITHGGYGLGDSYAVLTRHAPNARLIQGFALQADQERKTMESVNAWLTDLNVAIATTGSKTR